MYCKTCGRLTNKESNFCSECGSSFLDEEIKNKKGIQKQTWIIMLTSILLSLAIGSSSTIFSASKEVKEVVELVVIGDNEAISTAQELMGNLSNKQKKDVFDKINESLVSNCDSYISKGEFSDVFYEDLINIGLFLNQYGKIKDETIKRFPTIKFCYQELLNNEKEDVHIWKIGEKYVNFLEEISADMEEDIIAKIQNAISVRTSYTDAMEYFQAKDYEQALEICAEIIPAEDDSKYKTKIAELKNDTLEEFGEQIPQEVTKILENGKYEDAWVLLKGTLGYFKDDTKIKEMFEKCVDQYIINLLDSAEYDKAVAVADESLKLLDSERIKAYKNRAEQEHWKLAYWSVLKGDVMEKEFCLYEVEGKEIPVLILIQGENYQFVTFNENTEQVESNVQLIQKYDKENDVFYKFEEHDQRGEYSQEVWGYPNVHVEEWLAYTFDGTEMVYKYSLKKEVSDANGEILDASYTFDGKDLQSELAYDAQLQLIKGSEGLATSHITDEEIEKALFN